MQSGIDARELDFKVTILADACATNDLALAELALRYAEAVGGMRIADSRFPAVELGQDSVGTAAAR